MSENATAAPADAPAAADAEASPTAAGEGAAAAPAAPKAPVEPPKERFNPRTKEFAALTRKDREVRQREQQLKQLEGRIGAYEAAQRTARENPDAFLRQAGLTYDDVTRYYVNGQKPDPEQRHSQLEQRLAGLEQTLKEREDALRQKEEAQVVRQFVGKIEKTVQDNPAYELIRELGAADQVYELIDLHYARTGELLDIDDAAKYIEDTLEEQESQRAQKLNAIEKIKRRLAPPATGPKGSSKPSPGPTAAGKTLTSDLAASKTNIPAPGKPESPDERWRRIKARLES